MRIAIVARPNTIFPANHSKSITHIMEVLISGLQERNHEVIVLAPGDSKINAELVPICNQHIPQHEDTNLVHTRTAQVRTLDQLQLLRHRIDIVHAHSNDVPGHFTSTGLLNGFNFPNITTMQSSIDIRNVDYFLRCRNPIISVSYNQRKACPTMNFVRNIYNSVDARLFPVVTNPQGYLCFLGRITPVKRPDLAIQLATQLGIPLKIAGPIDSNTDSEYFDRAIKPYLDNPYIEYLGELDMSEKIELLSNALCYLHPTGFRDPCPLAAIEASCCGTPTLAIRRGALSELIEDGITGILVEDFAEGYHEISRCFSLDRTTIAQRARERFDYRLMTYEYLIAYEEVLLSWATKYAPFTHEQRPVF